jgi:uncharacterized protein (TIGR01777 family)
MSASMIAISGSRGLIGRSLEKSVEASGRDALRIERTIAPNGELDWSCDELFEEEASVATVVHLAARNVAARRWNAKFKSEIRDSRIVGTSRLARRLARLKQPPRVLVCASAIGFYGDRGDETLDENSPIGAGFFPELCQAWEASTRPAAEAGIRVVHLRFGLVLAAEGGGLAKMLPAFRWGVGGRLGSGRQYWSWISLADAVRAIQHVIADQTIEGPVNAVSPSPVANREFTRALGRALGRPAILPAPAFLLRTMLGEMVGPLLLASARVLPRRLDQTGFVFQHARLEDALHSALET